MVRLDCYIHLDSRIRGNDRDVIFFALRAVISILVIPANAGIHEH
jgi:hypothetical protein